MADMDSEIPRISLVAGVVVDIGYVMAATSQVNPRRAFLDIRTTTQSQT